MIDNEPVGVEFAITLPGFFVERSGHEIDSNRNKLSAGVALSKIVLA